MKKALMYGAGNIGRGFVAQLFSQNGYQTVFVDINLDIINALNTAHRYPITIISNDFQKEIMIDNVSGINGADTETVAREIAECDIMCTAVGVNVLPRIIPNLARDIELRSKTGKELNIIICENKFEADIYLKKMIKDFINSEYHDYIDNNIGFVEASVGRMVPAVAEGRSANPLSLWVEPFCTLPIDKAALKGPIPALEGIVPQNNFDYYIQSKLFLHNMGHCMTAYLGKLGGYNYISEAIANDNIKYIVKNAMYASAEALSAEHGKPYSEVRCYADELIERFGNKYLFDTVERVGRDIKRKLSREDRLLGAITLCKKHNVDATCIKIGVAAALLFGEDYNVADIKM